MACSLSNVFIPLHTLTSSKIASAKSIPTRKQFSFQGRSCGVFPVAAADTKEDTAHVQKTNKEVPQKSRTIEILPLGLWNPFSTKTVRQMMNAIDSMMFPSRRAGEALMGGRAPWDVMEDEKELRLRFDMPGFSKEDIKVCVEDNVLVIKGEHHKDEKQKDNKWSDEGIFSSFNTRIALPPHCNSEEIRAELKDGVLYVNIPKVKVEPKVIDIDVK
eukprot:Gb_13755 [translate_table: standard]